MSTIQMIFAGLDFPAWTIVAVIYGFIGWFYESTIFSLCEQGKFMDRGAFLGPVCPIYAVVCTISYDLFSPVKHFWVLVLLAGAVTSLVELITSLVMEAIFHKRYWDYSYYPLNYEGRISVVAGLFFGLALAVMVKWLHPALSAVVMAVSADKRLILCLIIWLIFGVDMLWTFASGFFKKSAVAGAHLKLEQRKQARFDRLNERKESWEDFAVVRLGRLLLNKGKSVNGKLVAAEQRFKDRLH